MAVRERARWRLRGWAGWRTVGPWQSEDERAGLVAESRELLRIAGPITLAQLGGMAMTTMDTVMVGPLGAEALAALGLAGSLHFMILVVTTGTLFGIGPLVSQAYGAGDREGTQAVLVHGLWIALALSVAVTLVNTMGGPIAIALGQEAGVAALVGRYMWALAWGVPPMLVFVALRVYLEGMGLAKPAMVITLGGLGVNFLANSALIYGIDGVVAPMGAVGSGWATTIVRWAMVGALAGWMLRQPRLVPSRAVTGSLRAATFRKIVAVGFPTGAQVGLETGFFGFTAVMMGWFGAAELGTHQVTINLAATTFMVALGISLAGSIRVGQHIGAEDATAVRRAVVVTYLFAVSAMAVFALLFLGIPETLVRLYTSDPAVIGLGTTLLFVAALFQVFDGAQVAGICVLRGAADTRVPMLIAAAAYWVVGAPSAYVLGLPLGFGPVGVWSGMVLGLMAAAVLLGWRVHAIHWRGPVRRA